MKSFTRNPVIVVDVDNTVTDVISTEGGWVDNLNKLTGQSLSIDPGKSYPYNLTTLYEDYNRDEHDLFEFWKRRDVYDNAKPIEGSVEALWLLKRMGCDIVFCSVVKGDHSKSKYQFLERNFPFMDGCAFTREKGYMRADVIIDDRVESLNQFEDNVLKLCPETPYEQTTEPNGPIETFKVWSQVPLIIREYLCL